MCFKTVRIAYNFILNFKKNDQLLKEHRKGDFKAKEITLPKPPASEKCEYIQIIHVADSGEVKQEVVADSDSGSNHIIFVEEGFEENPKECYEYVAHQVDDQEETIESKTELVTEMEFDEEEVITGESYEVQTHTDEMIEDHVIEYEHIELQEGEEGEQPLEERQIKTEHNYDYKLMTDKSLDDATEAADCLIDSGASKKFHCCPLCQKLFVKWQIFLKHVTDHKEKSFKCLICSEKFDSTYVYLEHYKLVHMLQCRLCMKSFKAKSTFHYHMKQNHSKLITRYVCKGPDCNKVFHTKQSLKRHQSEHMDGFKYQCKECHITFKGYDKYRYHVQTIHEGERRHLCTVCGRRFFQNTHLLDHMWLHTGEKRYKCKKCGKSYTSSSHLKKHVTRVCMPDN